MNTWTFERLDALNTPGLYRLIQRDGRAQPVPLEDAVYRLIRPLGPVPGRPCRRRGDRDGWQRGPDDDPNAISWFTPSPAERAASERAAGPRDDMLFLAAQLVARARPGLGLEQLDVAGTRMLAGRIIDLVAECDG